jgi:iron complex outermembrane receptor protein
MLPAWAQPVPIPEISVTDTRLGGGIAGASTSIITAADIARSPSYTLTDILSREAGVQTQNLFGGVNGARSTVDLRGFGATGASNTLVLINGRRVHDLDLQGIDFAAIPLASIERVEITRGNSGAVLYGDGAVGGVINIVTKTAVNAPPNARIDGAFGSYNHREGNASANFSSGPFSASVYGNAIGTDGYRANNGYTQYNGVGDFRYTVDRGSLYLNITGNDQRLGLPAFRRVEPSKGINQVVTDPRGATTPFDYANTQGHSVTAGATAMLVPGAELIIDGGVRQKRQQAAFFDQTILTAAVPINFVDATLTTTSVTPRIKVDTTVAGLPLKSISGVDWYHDEYESPRSVGQSDGPIHRYDLSQTSLAAYSQQTLTVLKNTDIAVGGRIQRTSIKAADTFDANAPGACPFGFCGDPQGTPLDKSDTNRAFHVGLEHRLTDMVTIFGRHAQSFRVPNVDERVGSVTMGNGDPTNFSLKPQRSHDWEAGARWKIGPVNVQWSIYDMDLTDEIMFRFAPNFVVNNTNLDPTRRYGNETIASWQATDTVRFRANYAYTRAVFREGIFAGNDVPLSSPHTASAGVAWNIIDKRLVFDGVVRYVGARRMDNDQVNLQPLIPAFTVVDVRIGGEIEKFFWSASVQNLFDKNYYDYAVASPFPFGFQSAIGTFNAYPQPGRNFMVRAGVTF